MSADRKPVAWPRPTPRTLVLLVLAAALVAAGVRLLLGRVVPELYAEGGLTRVEAHAKTIRRAATESGVDAYLLAGVMMRESGGRIDAVSSAGALGLFQLMLPTAVERAAVLGVDHEPTRAELLADSGLNARLGANYLAYLIARFGAEEQALVAYNTGPTRLARWIRESGSYAAWRDEREHSSDVLAYARDVLRYREQFRERGLLD